MTVPGRPVVVCLCGSLKFLSAFADANLAETLAGRIVLSVGCITHTDEELGVTPDQKIKLDWLHRRKIDLCDEVLVLNVGGYMGESTRNEAAYAILHCKRVRWLEPEKIDDEIIADLSNRGAQWQ